MKKILKTTLIIALGLIIGGVSYTFTQKDKNLLLGDLSDALPSQIVSVDFADPSGSITPSNGIVTINSVDYVTTIPETGQADQSDILASSIFFVASPTMNCHAYDSDQSNCPLSQGCVWNVAGPNTCDPIVNAGVQISGNKIIVPSGHYPVDINIYNSNGVRATLLDQTITYSADIVGVVGDSISITLVETGAADLGGDSATIAVTVVGNAITVTFQDDNNASPETVGQLDIVECINSAVDIITAGNGVSAGDGVACTITNDASGLVTASGGTAATDAVALTATNLSGGVDATGISSLNIAPLNINSLSCENLQMQILRGQGSGTYTGTETLPTPAYSDNFDFNSSVYATGSVTVTAGNSGDTYLVEIGSLSGSTVPFNIDLNQTAIDIATDITNSIFGYTATAVTNVVNITKTSSGADTSSVDVDVNVYPTTTDVNMTGGVNAVSAVSPTSPDGNGFIMTAITAGTAADGINLAITDNNAVDCPATAAGLAALITSTSPNFVLDCDLDDSAVTGGPALTGTALAAAINDGTATTIDTVVTAVASGTGASIITAATPTLAGGVDVAGATGSVTVTAGDAGDTYLVTIGSDPGTAVNFNTDLNTTAADIATDITNNISGYTATAVATNVVTITATTLGVDISTVGTAVVNGISGGANPSATSAGMFGGGVPIDTIIISNPIAAETGQQTFAITFNFVDTLEEERAVIISSIGDGTYGINVKDEGTDTVATSENFIYAVNDLLGIASPFIATIIPGGRVQLISKELGIHTNDYTCMINNAYFPVSGLTIGNCFSGATAGTVDVLTQPLTMDNTMTQGDTALIYIAGGIGVTDWGTSHPSVLEVVPFGEIGEGGGGGTVQFIPEAFVGTEFIDKSNGTYNIDCETEYDTSDPVNIVSQECTVDFVIPVEYDSQDDFETIVYLGDEEVIVPVTLETGKLTGTIVGTGTYNYNTGLSVQLEGQVVGTVRGNAVGDASGIVSGNIYSDISVGVSVNYNNDLLTVNFPLEVTSSPTSASTISAEGDFISTVELSGEDAGITNYAILYAKRAGTSILTVTDELTCVAALEVEVLRKRVILDMVGKDSSDVFEVGESVQINAYLGSADAELDENENITYAQGIEWISSNPDVATIDASGVLSIVAPGIVNIMATYFVGDAEIDPVQSDPMTITVSKITGLTIALDESAQAVMSNAELNEAYESVLIILNDPKAAGRTITVEGETFDINLPTGTYNNDSERIVAIIAELETDINGMFSSPAPTVSSVVGLPGILILQPNTLDANGYIDISTTAVKEDLTIFPNFSNGISLPASETFGLMVIADYDNGRTKRLNTTDVTWINTPLNYLEQTALEAGLMKMGGITGTSTVIATYENADGTIINSNQLVVNVESGPEIEYARRIQSGSITQGSRITLRTKVTDVDTIADISEITTSIVRSEFNTYHSINSDTNAVWFTAETFENEVTVESESPPAPIVEGEEGEEEVETTTVILNYKTYSIPIEIPVDEYLYDGNYNLILSISDASNHTSNFVLPIYIGEQASGDVSGDGEISMVDVILAFQIASDPSSFTQAQLEAADMDHMGGVTMIDVILLFNRATTN